MVLVTGAAAVFGGVLALAAFTVDEEPSFTEQVRADTDATGEGGADVALPQTVGAVLEVTGDRSGEFTSDSRVHHTGDQFALEGDDGRILIARGDDGEPFIDQMSWDGLDFFLDPEDCTFTVGEIDDTGLTQTEISCVDIGDVRDTATITMEGVASLPTGLVAARDLPDPGGTVEVSGDLEEAWQIEGGTWGPRPPQGMWVLGLFGPDGSATLEGEDASTLTEIIHDEVTYEITDASCDARTSEVAVVDPDVALVELSLSCEDVELDDLGTIDLDGTVIVSRTRAPGGP